MRPDDARWTISGSEDLPISGATMSPPGEPRAVALMVHGWTGHMDRNVTPAFAAGLAERGVIAHRFTLSHAGVEPGGDEIVRADAFMRDRVGFCVEDIRLVACAVAVGELSGGGLPLILAGHSRGGATVYRCAAEAGGAAADACALGAGSPWPEPPAGVISLAATSAFTRFSDEMRRELASEGYIEKPCARSPSGVVRMGPSWYAHYLEHPGRDLFAETIADVRCPALVVHGDADDTVPIEHADRLCGMLARNRHVAHERADIPGADHNFGSPGLWADQKEPSRELGLALAAADGFLSRLVGV